MSEKLEKQQKEEKPVEKKHYLSGKEIRQIAKENGKIMRRLEKEKKRKLPQSAYTTQLKDEKNILEVDNLHSYFFTDQGVVKAVNGVSFAILLMNILAPYIEKWTAPKALGGKKA